MIEESFEGRVGFAVGTGRCGTHFLKEIMAREPGVASSHERGTLNETFHRYCKWYRVGVDDEGFLSVKQKEIETDLENLRYSFEASSYLSFSIPQLHRRFGARFILLVRRPDQVVLSFLSKNLEVGEAWYERPFSYADPKMAIGYQECRFFHHFLARIGPTEDRFESWNRMTRVGKLGWFWNALNKRVLEDLSNLPEDRFRVVQLENLSYDRYLDLATFLGIQPRIGRRTFDRIASGRPGGLATRASIEAWTSQEVCEFEREVAPIAEELGYEYRIKVLLETKAEGVLPVYQGPLGSVLGRCRARLNRILGK